MMGAGKTTVGRELARLGGREFLDTDAILVQRLCRPIPQLFAIYGEDAFRGHETAVLRSLQPGLAVISTGGGIVTREANWVEMRRLGTTIFLDIDEQVLADRLARSRKRRPLLEFEDWEDRLANLLQARREFYERADVIARFEAEPSSEIARSVFEYLEERE